MAAPAKTFPIGAAVVLSQLRRRGVVAEGPNHRGEYLVTCGKLSLWVQSGLLEATEAGKESKKRAESVVRRPKSPASTSQSIIRLDLHGKNREEAVRLVEEALDRALRGETQRGNAICLEVIHGLGTGAVKRAVHDYLSRSRVVSSYREDVTNPGVTWVYL